MAQVAARQVRQIAERPFPVRDLSFLANLAT